MEIRDRIRELRRVPARTLLPNPKNWRRHPDGQAAALKELLADVGYAGALVARELPDGGLELIDGHLRAETTPDTDVPVLVLDVTEEEADKLLASMDPLAAMAGTDQEALGSLLEGVTIESKELLAYLQAQLPKVKKQGQTDPDEIPGVPKEPVSRLGNLWLLGRHRVLCGDSSDASALERLVDSSLIGAVLTDPPYGINLDTDYSKIQGSKKSHIGRRVVAHSYPKVEGDAVPFDASPFAEAFSSVKEQFWFGANYYRRTLSESDLDGSWLVWDKRPSALNEGGGGIEDVVGASFELIWSKTRHQQRLLRQQWSGFTARNPEMARAHPTEKPVAVLEEILTRWTSDGAVVVDPFAGGGTTLIACERTGRTAFCLEIDPRYCDVIVARWEAFTGEKAVRADAQAA